MPLHDGADAPRSVRHLPVVSDVGRLVSMVTDRDLRDRRASLRRGGQGDGIAEECELPQREFAPTIRVQRGHRTWSDTAKQEPAAP